MNSKVKLNLVHTIQEYWSVLLVGLMMVFFAVQTESFFTITNFENILMQSSSLIILTMGMTFILLTSGLDLSVGSIMYVGAVLVGVLLISGASVVVVVIASIISALIFGMINGILIVRMGLLPFIVTLATFYVGRGLGLYLSETRAIKLPDGFSEIATTRLFGVPVPIITMLLLVILGHLVLTGTSFGRHIYAIGHSREKADKAGIPTRKILCSVYVLGGLCAGIAGVISLAQLGAVSPSFGLQNEFLAIAAAVIGGTSLFGGKGTVLPGCLVGVLLIQIIQNGLVLLNSDPYIHTLITGAILFIVVLIDNQKISKTPLH